MPTPTVVPEVYEATMAAIRQAQTDRLHASLILLGIMLVIWLINYLKD